MKVSRSLRPSLRDGSVRHRGYLQLLAEEIYLGEVDQLIAATADHRFEHEHPEAGGLFDGDRWRHRKFLAMDSLDFVELEMKAGGFLDFAAELKNPDFAR